MTHTRSGEAKLRAKIRGGALALALALACHTSARVAPALWKENTSANINVSTSGQTRKLAAWLPSWLDARGPRTTGATGKAAAT